MIYLDNAATTYPKSDKVYDAMDNANRNMAVNAGRGSYRIAREATKLIDETKKQILDLVNATPLSYVAFTPSITIAINEILNGLDLIEGDIVYVSPYEHNAVARTLHLLKKNKGIIIKELPIKEDTLEIDIEKMKYCFINDRPSCVCCTHISNVTGYILPIKEIFDIAKQYQAITILDTAQSLGLIDVNQPLLKADFIAFAGHKTLYGPFGIGGFIGLFNINLSNFIVGGTGSDSLNLEMPEKAPFKYESSSQNIIAIAGLKAALEELNIEENYTKEKELTQYLTDKIQEIDGVEIYLPDQENHIAIVSFNIEGYKAEDVGMILDQDYDISVRTGYHCAPFIHKYLKDKNYVGTVRVGLGKFNTNEEIDELIDDISDLL